MTSKHVQSPGSLRDESLLDVLWDSAVEAGVQTILFLLMGTLALNLVGGLFHRMIPSPPPGLARAEAQPAHASHPWQSSFAKHKVAIVFTVLFLLQTSGRLFGVPRSNSETERPSRIARIGRRLSEDWFTLIVGNAFGAMIAAMILVWLQKFSVAQMIWGWVLHSILPPLHNLAENVFGASRADWIGRWLSWYGQNQLKFDFWLIYLASVCDDLGLPNFKTLVRFSWRRIRNRNRVAPPSPTAQQPV